MRLLNGLLALVFPVKCPFCRTIIKEGLCCESCYKKMELITQDLCGKKMGEFYDGLTAAAYFDQTVRRGIHRFKFSKRPAPYAFFAAEMAKRIDDLWGDLIFDCVIAVPMTKKREKVHGYNQSALLAKRIAAVMQIPFYENLLVKVKETPPQSTLDFSQRMNNLKEAFLVKNKSHIAGRRVLLIDDVTTTGATFNECARTLKKAGAQSVYACAFAAVK